MIDNREDFSCVLTQISEILKNLEEESLKKIPSEMVEEIEKYKNTEYTFIYDKTRTLEEQDLFEETKDFIAAIYMMYLCEDFRRQRLLEKCKENEQMQREREAAMASIRFNFAQEESNIDTANVNISFNNMNENAVEEKVEEQVVEEIKEEKVEEIEEEVDEEAKEEINQEEQLKENTEEKALTKVNDSSWIIKVKNAFSKLKIKLFKKKEK